MPSLFEVIVNDHENCRERLMQLLDELPEDMDQLERLTHEIVIELRSHARAEEQALYEVIKEKASKEGEIKVYEFADEHEEIEKILTRLYHSSFESHRELRSDFAKLYEALEKHWAREESELFDLAHGLISRDEAQYLGELMIELKCFIKTEMIEEVGQALTPPPPGLPPGESLIINRPIECEWTSPAR